VRRGFYGRRLRQFGAEEIVGGGVLAGKKENARKKQARKTVQHIGDVFRR